MTVPRTAVFSSLALVMRWNTSCCGTEPKAKAKKAPAMTHQPLASDGKKLNLPSAAACATTLLAPPAMSLTSTATSVRPMRMTTVWNRSVNATDHMPPNKV